jgi:hypothetical protein
MNNEMYCPIETAKNLKAELECNLHPHLNFIEALNRLIATSEAIKNYMKDAGITDAPVAKHLAPFPCQYHKEIVDA